MSRCTALSPRYFTGPTHTTGLIYLMQLAYELPDFLAFGKFSHLCAGARLRLRQEPRLARMQRNPEEDGEAFQIAPPRKNGRKP